MSQTTIQKCLNCRTEFVPKRSSAEFCSAKCRAAYARDKDKLAKLLPTLGKTDKIDTQEDNNDKPETEIPKTPRKNSSYSLNDAPISKIDRLKWFTERKNKI